MPKGLREPMQELEGGKGFGGMGGGGGGGLSKADAKGLALALGPVGAVGPAGLAMGEVERRKAEAAKKEKAEAAAELKRESSRGMKKGGAVKGWGKARGARAAKYY